MIEATTFKRPLCEWEVPIYQALQSLEEETFVIGEVVYKPFWNGVFGPMLGPLTVEIVVKHADMVLKVHEILVKINPNLRWVIHSLGDDREIASWQKCQSINVLSGVVQVTREKLTYLGESFLYDEIKAGILSANSPLNEKEMEGLRDLISWYPGLKCTSIQVETTDIFQEWDEMLEDIHRLERGGRIQHDTLSTEQMKINHDIQSWHEAANKKAQLYPFPPSASLPNGNPWEAKDDEFREWILRQTFLKDEKVMKDEYLEHALSLQKGVDQKPTHQGWEIYQHAVCSMLMLDTERLSSREKALLRIVMLWHDAGKIDNVWTPGAHGGISAKTWTPPSWMTEIEKECVSFLIRTHDWLGLMDRWLRDPSYKGGLSPKFIVEAIHKKGYDVNQILPLMSAVYQADISSVSSLKWLLPLTPLLEAMIVEQAQLVQMDQASRTRFF